MRMIERMLFVGYRSNFLQCVSVHHWHAIKIGVVTHQIEAITLLHRYQVQRITGPKVVLKHGFIHRVQVSCCNIHEGEVGIGT